MIEENPYAAPKSEIAEVAPPRGRPGWVWVIFVFYMFGLVSTTFSTYLVYSGGVELQEAQRRYFDSLTPFDYLLTAAITGTNAVAAIQLFRLRKSSAFLFPAAFALSLLVTAWHAAAKGWYGAVDSAGFAGSFIGWTLSTLICLYAWRLAKNGVLK